MIAQGDERFAGLHQLAGFDMYFLDIPVVVDNWRFDGDDLFKSAEMVEIFNIGQGMAVLQQAGDFQEVFGGFSFAF